MSTNKTETWGDVFAFMLAMVIAFAAGLASGLGLGADGERSDAIKAGAAEWRIDAKTGARSFHYIKPNHPTP